MFQISGLSVVGRSTQRALNLKKNWVSTDASPGLAASVISNNKENTMKSSIINTKEKDIVSEDKKKPSPVISTVLKKEVDQSKAMPSPLAKYEARQVPSISASIQFPSIRKKTPISLWVFENVLLSHVQKRHRKKKNFKIFFKSKKYI